MRCALVGAVGFNAEHFRKQHFDLVIAADKGYASLRAIGVEPDIALGDFDSLGRVPEGGDVRSYPVDKDESDMELACDTALGAGAGELVLYGCLSARLDHTIANLQLLFGLAKRGVRAFGVGEGFVVAPLYGPGPACELGFRALDPAALDGRAYGRYISVFAAGGPAAGVTEEGLKWELSGFGLPDDVSRGLSNEFTGAPARIAVERGGLLVTFDDAAWPYLLR